MADLKKQRRDGEHDSIGCCVEPGCCNLSVTSIVDAVAEAEAFMNSINVLSYTGDVEEICNVAPERVKVKVAIDSAACANVINPEELPSDADFEPNHTNKHFVGANDSRIERYGTCQTIMSSELGDVGCDWDMAAVSRALHSVGVVAGPKGGPGKQDVLFDNDHCYVVAPGIVKQLMLKLKAVAKYEREGNLYVGEVTLSGFRRPGPTK